LFRNIYQTTGATSQETARCAVISLKTLNFTNTKILFFFVRIIKIKYRKSVGHPISSYGPAVSSVDFHSFLVL